MWDQIREKAKESYHEFFSTEHQALPPSSPYEKYANMDFSSGLGVWPSDMQEHGTSSPPVDGSALNRLYWGINY